MAKRPGSPATNGPLEADVLIVGAGLVGAALACALGQAGVRVGVVDVMDPAAGLDAGFDGRASAIALGSRRVLDGIGVWPHLAETAAPILDIRVSERGSLLYLHYDSAEVGDEPFGHMVENRHMRRGLMARLGELDTVQVVAPARIAEIERTSSGVTARLEDGRRLSARLTVGADGRGSLTRQNAGIRVTKWSYDQWGIVCTVKHDEPHNFIAHEHFMPAGPFAILPLSGKPDAPGRLSSLVWTEKADLAPALVKLDDDAFMEELRFRFGDFMGGLEVIGPRWTYPLGLQFAERATDPRLALVGDASHAMHPIAGQGLNMGLRDVAALAEVVLDAKRLGLDVGDATALERYERWRRFDNTLMLAATDGLNRLFSNDIKPLKLARDLGLAVVDKIPPLKKTFMRQAMGLSGDLPRLMRGQRL